MRQLGGKNIGRDARALAVLLARRGMAGAISLSMGGSTWTYAGSMYIQPDSSSPTTLTVENPSGGGLTLDVDGDITLTGNLIAYRDTTEYTGYIFVPFSNPVAVYDAQSNVSSTAITVTDYSVPSQAKAVAVLLKFYHATAGNYAQLLTGSSGYYPAVEAYVQYDARWGTCAGVVRINTDSTIYLSVSNATNQVSLYFVGYYI